MKTSNTPEINKRYYEKNREKQMERVKRNKNAIRAYIRIWKEVGPCTDCGVFYPYYVMDADHLRDKKFDINRSTQTGMKKVIAELAKCERVCSNCHRIRSYKRQGLVAQLVEQAALNG